jgi:hypothetical protein
VMGVFNSLFLFKRDEKQIGEFIHLNWPKAGRGTRLHQLTFKLRSGSNGTTASRSPPPTSNAPGTCCSANRGLTQPAQSLVPKPRRHCPDDRAVTFVLKRSQPAFLMLLASGISPRLSCHVNPRDMHPRSARGPSNSPNSSRRIYPGGQNPDY